MAWTPELHRLIGAGLLLPLLAAPAWARTIYCCELDNGKKTCADLVPPQCTGRAVTEIGAGGVVRRHAAPATPEERARAEAEARRQAEEINRAAVERQRNKALLDTYSSVQEIELRRDRQITEIERSVEHLKNEQLELNKRRDKLKRQFDALAGKPVPPDLAAQRQSLDDDQKSLDEQLQMRKQEIETTRTRFDDDKRRYEALIANPAAR